MTSTETKLNRTYTKTSLKLADGERTTMHVLRYVRKAVTTRVAIFTEGVRLADWCKSNGTASAISGSFFCLPAGPPLGEMWIRGKRQTTEPFREPWDKIRGALHISAAGHASIGWRNDFTEHPEGDLVQAGPVLVRYGHAVIPKDDREGFSHPDHKDIIDGRHPRAAIGLNDTFIWAVVADGRTEDDAGLTLPELASYFVRLGATDALNLDGGGSASLVSGGVLRNISRNNDATVNPHGRPIYSAIIFS